MARFYWKHAPDEDKAGRTLEDEVARFRRACRRLASWRAYPDGTYIRVARRACSRRGEESGYMLTKKGARVRRKIARGTLAGWTDVVDSFPTRRDRRTS